VLTSETYILRAKLSAMFVREFVRWSAATTLNFIDAAASSSNTDVKHKVLLEQKQNFMGFEPHIGTIPTKPFGTQNSYEIILM
jgi:hypothetical protein